MAVSLAVFKTHCDLCPSEFNTTTALLRHREAKHHINAHLVTILPFYNGQEVIRLPPRIRRGQRSSSYKQWISGTQATSPRQGTDHEVKKQWGDKEKKKTGLCLQITTAQTGLTTQERQNQVKIKVLFFR